MRFDLNEAESGGGGAIFYDDLKLECNDCELSGTNKAVYGATVATSARALTRFEESTLKVEGRGVDIIAASAVPMPEIVLTMLDEQGASVTNAPLLVTAAAEGTAIVSGTSRVEFQNGRAVFTNLRLTSSPGSLHWLVFKVPSSYTGKISEDDERYVVEKGKLYMQLRLRVKLRECK